MMMVGIDDDAMSDLSGSTWFGDDVAYHGDDDNDAAADDDDAAADDDDAAADDVHDDDHEDNDDDNGDDDDDDCQCTCTPVAIFPENAAATSRAFCQVKTHIRLFNIPFNILWKRCCN